MTQGDTDPACAVAHGTGEPPSADAVAHGAPAPGDVTRTLVAVFDSPVASYLLRYGADCGFRVLLLEPDAGRAAAAAAAGTEVVTDTGGFGPAADVVVTDHHRPELDAVVRDLLAVKARWIGVMGNPRHPAPYIPGLIEFGVPAEEVARVHRPVGLNIGSRTPPEIALATLAGLIADRNGRPGGFTF
ncbi:MAG TPA: XdhC family protein [Streptosporangiaceae bacterium]|jgi:xanthine/CO dehydrogenase XdhC/CoxF family maturation factor|nr:XdhC family protein [Streptosporangiaceae bacterium]